MGHKKKQKLSFCLGQQQRTTVSLLCYLRTMVHCFESFKISTRYCFWYRILLSLLSHPLLFILFTFFNATLTPSAANTIQNPAIVQILYT